MKKIICALLAISLITFFVSCNNVKDNADHTKNSDNTNNHESKTDPPNNKASLYEVDGNYYIDIENLEYYESLSPPSILSVVTTSYEPFKEQLLNGSVDEYHLKTIAHTFPRDENGIQIFDPYNVYIPVIPQGLALSAFYCRGRHYGYFFEVLDSDMNITFVGIGIYSEEELEKEYELSLKDSSDEMWRTLENDKKSCRIKENGGSISMFVTEGELYYLVQLSANNADIDDEWLLSFSIEKYVEE